MCVTYIQYQFGERSRPIVRIECIVSRIALPPRSLAIKRDFSGTRDRISDISATLYRPPEELLPCGGGKEERGACARVREVVGYEKKEKKEKKKGKRKNPREALGASSISSRGRWRAREGRGLRGAPWKTLESLGFSIVNRRQRAPRSYFLFFQRLERVPDWRSATNESHAVPRLINMH